MRQASISEGGHAALRGVGSLAARLRAGELDAAAFAGLYFLHWQIAAHGHAFASRKRKGDPRPAAAAWLAGLATADAAVRRQRLLDYLECYQFRGVAGAVPAALGHWLRGRWPLELRLDIPGPAEVLRRQARGTRPVTALAAYPRMLEPVLGKRDAFAFFQHDLEHAHKFFHSPALHEGQRAFFGALETALDRGAFAPYFEDPVFARQFHYLMGDMNTHPQHSRQYLRAILIEYHLRREGKAPAAPLAPGARRQIDGVMRALEAPPALHPHPDLPPGRGKEKDPRRCGRCVSR